MSSPVGRPDRWQRLWDVFHAALERQPDERADVVDVACPDDPQLAQEVRELLAAHVSDGILDQPVATFPPEPPPLAPGDRLAGRFRIVRQLGEGGMGSVYEAMDEALDARVAVKTLHRELARDSTALERFRREVTLARRVTHPNACRIFELWEDQNAAAPLTFLTMELVEGETLAERLVRSGPLSEEEALPIAEEIAAALGAAHRVGVVHRDLKSANVMLVPGGAGAQALRTVVTDFGLAALSAPPIGRGTRISGSGQLLGTPTYMAPEQLEGRAATPATDIYAFGLLLYEMLTGTVPFAGESPLTLAIRRVRDRPVAPRSLRPGLGSAWNAAILRCLEPDPSDRFPTPEAVVAALRGRRRLWPRWTPGRARRIFRRTVARRRAVVALALFATLAAVGARVAVSRSGTAPGPALEFAARDFVLVADIENRTGDAVLDDTIRFALERELNTSRFVNVVPRERVADALRLMKRPDDSPLTGETAREVALRDGGIRAVVRGRTERLGNRYVTALELLEPARGTVVASFAEEAAGLDGILSSVRALSRRLRLAIGEELAALPPAQTLPPVTTSSLRALQLFSRADALIAHRLGDAAAEELLAQAIAEDPEFASAHMHLAHAVLNQGRLEEALAHAARAMALTGSVGEAERQFIRGGYYSMIREYERALASYQALLAIHPDHFWGTNNVAMTLSFGLLRGAEAIPYFQRALDLRPHDFMVSRNMAWNIAVRGNNFGAARAPIDRARELLTPELARQHGSAAIWVELLPAYARWLDDDVAGALGELQRLEGVLSDHPARSPLAYHMMRAYEVLGRFDDGYALVKPLPISAVGLVLAYLRDDQSVLNLWRTMAAIDPQVRNSLGAIGPIVLARLGRPDLAKTALPRARTDRTVAPLVFEHAFAGAMPIVQGEIALAEGRPDEAIRLIETGLPAERLTGSAVYFLGCESLAAAWLQLGAPERAVVVLEEAFAQRPRTVQGSGAFWLRTVWHLAQAYGRLGRADDRVRTEDLLRRLLAFADPDHPMLAVAETPGAAR